MLKTTLRDALHPPTYYAVTVPLRWGMEHVVGVNGRFDSTRAAGIVWLVAGGSGDDRINVVRGDHDTVRCGAGRDVVLADPADRVAGDCEDVRR